MRTSVELRNLTTNEIQFSDLINGQTQDLFDLQDKLVVSVLSSFDLEEDKVRVSNEGIETIEELRLLHFAAKEREKWTGRFLIQHMQMQLINYSLLTQKVIRKT